MSASVPGACQSVDRELARAVVGERGASARLAKEWEHIKGCDRCLERYEQSMLMIRGLERGSIFQPGEVEIEIGLARVIGQGGQKARSNSRVRLLSFAAPLAIAASLAVALAFYRFALPKSADRGLVPRSGSTSLPLAIRTFCKTSDTAEPLALSSESGPSAQGRCPLSSTLVFACISQKNLFVMPFAMEPQGRVRALALPASAAADGLKVPASRVLTSLPFKMISGEADAVVFVYGEQPLLVERLRLAGNQGLDFLERESKSNLLKVNLRQWVKAK